MRLIPWQRAERVAKRRLDRRRRYALDDDGTLLERASWSEICSGCSVYGCTDTGCGCHECGHTGRRRRVVYVPTLLAHEHRAA